MFCPKRVNSITLAQGNNLQIKEQIETYSDFLKYVNTSNGGKDNIISLHLLHQLSASWKRMSELDLAAPDENNKVKNSYLEQSLKFKEEAAAMGARLNAVNKQIK